MRRDGNLIARRMLIMKVDGYRMEKKIEADMVGLCGE